MAPTPKSILSAAIPLSAIRFLKHFSGLYRGYLAWRDRIKWPASPDKQEDTDVATNQLHEYFKAHRTGYGIYKWDHYFDIYDRHFRRFRGRDVVIVEIGIYSGGSLDMWESYFGKDCHIYGVDIEKACKSYEREKVTVFIGDQEDPGFL